MLKDDTGSIEQEVDARSKYFCYKSFDHIDDVERLKSLSEYFIDATSPKTGI